MGHLIIFGHCTNEHKKAILSWIGIKNSNKLQLSRVALLKCRKWSIKTSVKKLKFLLRLIFAIYFFYAQLVNSSHVEALRLYSILIHSAIFVFYTCATFEISRGEKHLGKRAVILVRKNKYSEKKNRDT